MKKFQDLKDNEKTETYLFGKQVLFQYGSSYDKKLSRKITKIIKVNKRSFKIESDKNLLFDLDYGNIKHSHWSTTSFCEIFENENEIKCLRKEFAYNKTQKYLLQEISLFDFSKLDNQQLEKIIALTKQKIKD